MDIRSRQHRGEEDYDRIRRLLAQYYAINQVVAFPAGPRRLGLPLATREPQSLRGADRLSAAYVRTPHR